MVSTQVLAQSDLFADLAAEQLAKVASLAEEVTCAQGETLFQEGGPASHLFILLEGRVAVQVQLTTRPGRIITTSLSQAGQMVGWSGFVPPRHYTASAVCEANCRLLAIPGDDLMQLLEQHPEMGFLVMRRAAEIISGRLRNIQQFVLTTM